MRTLCELDLRAVAIPYRTPVRWEGGVEDTAYFMILTARDEDGRTGMAECTVKPTWNGFDPESFTCAFERLVLPLLTLAVQTCQPLAQALGRLVENSAPKSLLENALWDIDEVGSTNYSRVPVSATVTRAGDAMMAETAAGLVESEGYRVLKIKGGKGIREDSATVARIREAVGPDVDLYVDANGALSQEESHDYVSQLVEQGVIAVEDPYNLIADSRLTRLQQEAAVPIIADFRLDGISATRAFLDAGCGGISLKPSRFGMRKIEAMAAAVAAQDRLGVIGMFGESHAGAVLLLRAHHLLSSGTRLLPVEAGSPFLLADHYLKQALSVSDGAITCPQLPLASIIDHERLDRLTLGEVARWVAAASGWHRR